MTVAAAVALLAVALAPTLPLPYVAGPTVARARALWLLGILTVGIVYVAQSDLWLSLIGLWFLIQWPRHADPPTLMPSALLWAGVGATWGLLLALPRELLAWAPWGWLLVAARECVVLIVRKFRLGARQKGAFGSPVLTALYLALIAPFCPWWGWPLLGAGLLVVSSFHAFAAAGVGAMWVLGDLRSWLLGAFLALLGAILWAWSPVVWGQRLLEWTPRGDTFDSIVSRWRGWQLIWHHGRANWLLGAGPGTMEPALLRWGSRYDLELTWGEGFNELLHFWYEYGALGLVAVAAFVWRVSPGLKLGDPWAAAWVAGVVLAVGHWPLRHVSIGLPWLAVSAYLATAR